MKTFRLQILLSGLLFSIHFLVFAQSKSRLGLVAGISQSWDLEAKDYNFINLPGYRIGVNTRIPLSKNIHFQPEIALVHRIIGYNNSERSGGITTQSKIRNGTTMIQIPVSVQFGRKTYFGFGFAYGFPFRSRTSGTITTTGGGQNTSNDFSESADLKDVWPYKPLDIGLCIGNRTKQLGWEIRPTFSTNMTPNFWIPQEESQGSIFHITAVLIWKIK